MKNIYKIAWIFIVSIFFVQCSDTSFLIERNRVGKLTNKHVISDIEIIFSKDSVVKRLSEGILGSEDTKYIQDEDNYLIYSKQGKHLLTIVPRIQHDSTSKIKYIEIIDAQFKTKNGLSLRTPFKEINFKHTINTIETSFSSVILYVDKLNATISMRKKDIGINPFTRQKVVLEQIPDMTKINHFTIWFD